MSTYFNHDFDYLPYILLPLLHLPYILLVPQIGLCFRQCFVFHKIKYFSFFFKYLKG